MILKRASVTIRLVFNGNICGYGFNYWLGGKKAHEEYKQASKYGVFLNNELFLLTLGRTRILL